MGVPVITLKGSHYVSRMSTAVLAGAQLEDWIADSEADYLSKAKKQRRSCRSYDKIGEFGVNNSSNHPWVILWVDACYRGCLQHDGAEIRCCRFR